LEFTSPAFRVAWAAAKWVLARLDEIEEGRKVLRERRSLSKIVFGHPHQRPYNRATFI